MSTDSPGDVLQDFIVAGEVVGEEKLVKFAVMAVLAGIVLHNDRRVSVDASCLLPKKLLDTEELTEWLSPRLNCPRQEME